MDTLSSRAGTEALSSQSPDHILLGVLTNIFWNVQPPFLVLRPQGLIVGVEEILELNTSLLSADCTVASMVQYI